jgi:hypothetical protein
MHILIIKQIAIFYLKVSLKFLADQKNPKKIIPNEIQNLKI